MINGLQLKPINSITQPKQKREIRNNYIEKQDCFVKTKNNVSFSGASFNYEEFFHSLKEARVLIQGNKLSAAIHEYKKKFFEIEKHIFHNRQRITPQNINTNIYDEEGSHLFSALKASTRGTCSSLLLKGETEKARNYYKEAEKITKSFHLGDNRKNISEIQELRRELNIPHSQDSVIYDAIPNQHYISPEDETRELSTEMIEKLLRQNVIEPVITNDVRTDFLLESAQYSPLKTSQPQKSAQPQIAKADGNKASKLIELYEQRLEQISAEMKRELGFQFIDPLSDARLKELGSKYQEIATKAAHTIKEHQGSQMAIEKLRQTKEFLKSYGLM